MVAKYGIQTRSEGVDTLKNIVRKRCWIGLCCLTKICLQIHLINYKLVSCCMSYLASSMSWHEALLLRNQMLYWSLSFFPSHRKVSLRKYI